MAGFQGLVKSQKQGNSGVELIDPATQVVTTPASCLSDTLNLREEIQGLHANTAGDVKILDTEGNTVTLTLVASQPYPYRIRRIYATGTTIAASALSLLYQPY